MAQKPQPDEKTRKWLGLILGLVFGFLLHRGGVATYDVILAQLLLEDFTVVKIMLTAVIVGTVGVHAMVSLGVAELSPKPGSVGVTVIGGLIFGLGFATLGYCPGTVAAAAGSGKLDALVGGVVGILVGSWIFAVAYPRLQGLLKKGDFGNPTLPELLKVNHWVVVVPLAILLTGLLYWLETALP